MPTNRTETNRLGIKARQLLCGPWALQYQDEKAAADVKYKSKGMVCRKNLCTNPTVNLHETF